MGGFRYVLGQKAFRHIWLAQISAQVADKFLMFSLLILAYRISGGSTPVAVTLLAYTVPAIVIGPSTGVFADRRDRKRIMVIANTLRGLLVVLIPLAALFPALRGDFIHILVITIAFSVVGQFFSPAEAASIPAVLPRSSLLSANSVVLMTQVLTLVVGGTLAPIVSRVDIYLPYWVAGGLFLIAAAFVVVIRIPAQPQPESKPGEHPFRRFLAEMKEGLDFIRGSRAMLVTFLQVTLAMLVMFMIFTLAPAYVSRVIKISTQDTYVVLVPATVGAFVSGIGLGQFGRGFRRDRILFWGLVAMGLTLLALALGPQVMNSVVVLTSQTRWFGAVFSLALGLELGALMIPALAFLMENTADEMRGRVFALVYVVINGVSALPVLIAAALADALGTATVLGGMGVILVGVAIALRKTVASALAAPGR